MKKLILLALVALVAGAAFAESAPAFSGSFELFTTMDFEDETYKVNATNDALVELNGVVSDWATVSAELGVDQDNLEDGQNLNVSLNSFTLTTDITGALGTDGPVGVSVEWGYINQEAAEYNGVAGYEDYEPTDETGSYFGFNLTLSIMEKVNLIVMVPPSTYTDYTIWYGDPAGDNDGTAGPYDAVISVEMQFLQLVDGLDFNIWYADDPQEGFQNMGLTLGYDMAPLAIGAAFKYDLEAETAEFGVAAQYDIGDLLTAGVAFAVADFSNFGDTSGMGLNATFHAVPDMLDLFIGVKLPFLELGDNFALDTGVQFFLAGVTYTLGYDYNGSGFQSPDGQGIFFKVQADF